MSSGRKTNAKPRRVLIVIDYHYETPGRRSGIRKDISKSVVNAVVRRLRRHGALVVDHVEIHEDEEVVLGA